MIVDLGTKTANLQTTNLCDSVKSRGFNLVRSGNNLPGLYAILTLQDAFCPGTVSNFNVLVSFAISPLYLCFKKERKS